MQQQAQLHAYRAQQHEQQAQHHAQQAQQHAQQAQLLNEQLYHRVISVVRQKIQQYRRRPDQLDAKLRQIEMAVGRGNESAVWGDIIYELFNFFVELYNSQEYRQQFHDGMGPAFYLFEIIEGLRHDHDIPDNVFVHAIDNVDDIHKRIIRDQIFPLMEI